MNSKIKQIENQIVRRFSVWVSTLIHVELWVSVGPPAQPGAQKDPLTRDAS